MVLLVSELSVPAPETYTNFICLLIRTSTEATDIVRSSVIFLYTSSVIPDEDTPRQKSRHQYFASNAHTELSLTNPPESIAAI